MSATARINPKDLFTSEEWNTIVRRSAWKGYALLAHCWGTIFAAGAVALIWPITIPIAVMLIGARQLGLGIIQHDAAHGALHPNPKINDWLGEHLTPGGVVAYRAYHLTHHRNVQQHNDPDLALSSPFPTTPQSLRRKIVRDLTGQTYWKQKWAPLFKRIDQAPRGKKFAALGHGLWARRRFLIGAAVTIAVTAPFGYWWAWSALWLLPQATWLPMITRLRNIAEHALVPEGESDPYRQARTTHANLLERAFLAPYWVNYHCEHHLFMYVPCYNLPRLHRRLREKGLTDRMLTAPGYFEVLRQAASKPALEDRGGNLTPEERGVVSAKAAAL